MNLQHRDYVEHGWMTLRAKLKEKNHRKWKKKKKTKQCPTCTSCYSSQYFWNSKGANSLGFSFQVFSCYKIHLRLSSIWSSLVALVYNNILKQLRFFSVFCHLETSQAISYKMLYFWQILPSLRQLHLCQVVDSVKNIPS